MPLSQRHYKIVDVNVDESTQQQFYEMVEDNIQSTVRLTNELHVSEGGAGRTHFNLHEDKRCRPLLEWLSKCIPYIVSNFGMDRNDPHIWVLTDLNGTGGGHNGFDPKRFELCETWGVIYDEDEGVVDHNHFPYSLSFCYYVRTPQGSAPLMVDDEVFHMKAGQIIIFNSCLYHSVQNNNCKGRCAIVGNIIYNPPDCKQNDVPIHEHTVNRDVMSGEKDLTDDPPVIQSPNQTRVTDGTISFKYR